MLGAAGSKMNMTIVYYWGMRRQTVDERDGGDRRASTATVGGRQAAWQHTGGDGQSVCRHSLAGGTHWLGALAGWRAGWGGTCCWQQAVHRHLLAAVECCTAC